LCLGSCFRSESLSSDSSGQLDVLGHDGDSASMDGAEVGVLEEANQVGFSGLLEGKDGRALESEFSLVLVGDFTDESLEGELADQEVGALLIFSDFSQGNGAGSELVGFLHTTGSGGALSGGLGSQLLSGGLGTGRLSGSLLGSSHFI